MSNKDLGFVSGFGGDYASKVHLTHNSKALNDNVIIEILEQENSSKKYGDIILPETALINVQMLKGKVISVGPDITDNLNVGDIVMYDAMSAYYCPPQTPGTLIITKYENVIGLWIG